MRQSFVNLVEAVRGLQLSRTGQPAPNCVRIGDGDRECARAFPERLLAVLDALEAFERDGGTETDPEIERVKAGLDGVFRWIRLQGLSTDEPLDIMAEALGGKRKRQKRLPLLPAFAPNFTKRKTWKPKLSTASRLDGTRSPESMSQNVDLAWDMQQVVSKMGAAAPPPPPRDDRSVATMGPC